MQGQNNQVDTSVVQFDKLPSPPALDQNLLNTLDSHIKGNWKGSQQCVTMIRSICKFYPQYIPDIFMKYGPAILDFFNHTTTLLIKNVLKLLQEIFSHGQTVNLEGCVQAFLPQLIKKAALDSCAVTKEMSQQVLTVIASNCCYCNTIELTVQISCDVKHQLVVAEIAIKMLAGILSTLGSSITQVNPNTLQIIMRGLNFLINGKRNNMKTSALDVCIFIFNQIGAENFLNLMNYSLGEREVMAMGQAMETHRTQKSKPLPFAEHRRTQGFHSGGRQSDNFGQNLRM